MTKVRNLQELAMQLDIEVEDESDFKALPKAIQAGRIFVSEDGRLGVRMKEPVKVFSEQGEAPELLFRRAKGREHKVLQNAPLDKRGDAIQRCICNMCNITGAQLEDLDSPEVRILEEVFQFFS